MNLLPGRLRSVVKVVGSIPALFHFYLCFCVMILKLYFLLQASQKRIFQCCRDRNIWSWSASSTQLSDAKRLALILTTLNKCLTADTSQRTESFWGSDSGAYRRRDAGRIQRPAQSEPEGRYEGRTVMSELQHRSEMEKSWWQIFSLGIFKILIFLCVIIPWLKLMFVCFVGDEILGATINFEQLSKEEVLRVLKVMEPFNDKVHVFTRNSRSKSLGNLDQCVSTETVGGTQLYNRRQWFR